MAIPDDARWRVEFLRSARDELDDVEDGIRFEILAAIVDLEEEPRPPDSILLRGYTNLYRIKAYRGEYRVIYTISEKQRKVIIERVRPAPWRTPGYVIRALPEGTLGGLNGRDFG